MLVRLFNQIYQFIQSNRILKYGYYFTLLVYPVLLFLLYKKWGLRAIGIHTNILLPLYIITLTEILHQVSIFSKNFSDKIKRYTTIYLIIELLLVIIRPDAIYKPGYWGQYLSQYETKELSFYHTRVPDLPYHLKQTEFNFERIPNSLGIPDKEWSINKPEKNIRILCLGDSFTEGDGAHNDSSYVSFLRRILQEKNADIEVMNAGRCGSDPFFDFRLLKDKIIRYQPDIIVQSFTTNDFYYDMILRGGEERFQKDSTLKFRHNYWWEPIYAASFISRIIIQTIGGFDKDLIKKNEYKRLEDEMRSKSVQLFRDYQSFTKENNIELVVFTLPFKPDLTYNDQNLKFFQEFKKKFSTFNLKFYNLQDCYEEEFKRNNTLYQEYYWKKDGHHNAKGYQMMAKCIEQILIQNSLLPEHKTYQ